MQSTLKQITLMIGIVILLAGLLTLWVSYTKIGNANIAQKERLENLKRLTPEIRQVIKFIEGEALMPFEAYGDRSVVEHKFYAKYKDDYTRFYGFGTFGGRPTLWGLYLKSRVAAEEALKTQPSNFIKLDEYDGVYFSVTGELPYQEYASGCWVVRIPYDIQEKKLWVFNAVSKQGKKYWALNTISDAPKDGRHENGLCNGSYAE